MTESPMQKMARLRELRNRAAHGAGAGSKELARQMRELGFDVADRDAQWAMADLVRGDAVHFLPPPVLGAFLCAFEGRSVTTLCDPFAGSGVLAASLSEEAAIQRTVACVPNEQMLAFARSLAPQCR
jgi:hypothetical protein